MSSIPNAEPEEVDVRENKFKPLPKQEEFIKSGNKMVMLSGGFGTGKSRVGCEKGYFLNMQYPGNRGLIVRRHFSDVKASTIQQTLLEEVIPESHIVDHNKSDHIIRHKTGMEDPTEEPVLSEIQYHGLDSGKSTGDDDLPRKIGSMAYGWIFVDEGSELSKGEWTQLQGRLRYTGKDQGGMHYPVPFRQIFTATNPDAPTHWMYDLFFNQNQGKVIEMSVDDNIHLADDYVENMKSQFQGVYYDRYFEGKWVGAEGMIYEAWDRNTHLRDWNELPGNWTKEMEQNWANDEGKGVWATPPDNWQIYRGIDFGYNNPFVCYDEETEILTEDGWVDFPELEKGTDVATLNQNTKEVEYQTPISYIDQRYKGEMIKAESNMQGANFCVTPNHRMLVENRKTGEMKKVRADSMPNYDHSIPVGWNSSTEECDEEIDIEHIGSTNSTELKSVQKNNFAKFLGLWLADGSSFQGHIKIVQKNKIDEVRQVFKQLGWKWSEYENSNGVVEFSIDSIDLWEFFKQNDILNKSDKKTIPRFVFDWCNSCLESLLEGLMIGDGSKDNKWNKNGKYHTTSKKLADDVQEIASRLGIPSKINKQKRKGGYETKNTKYLYNVNFHEYDRATIESLPIKTVEYDGRVYCVEVPNGTVIVRRKGRPMASGNCQWYARSPDDELVLFREIYKTETLVEDIAKQIKSNDPTGFPIEQTFADHDAEDAATLRRHGVETSKAKKDVQQGIQAVMSRLRLDERDRPRIYVMRNARVHPPDENLNNNNNPLSTREEIPTYTWKNDDEDKPEKEDDHGCDAMRYVVYSIDSGNTPSKDEMDGWAEIINSSWQ